MKNRTLSIVAALVVLALFGHAEAVAKKTARVFILSGQSNAAGNGNGDDLTAAQRKIDPEVLITFSDGVWEPLAPIKLKKPKAKFNINNTIFGTELSFAKAIKQAYPDDIIAICKVGVCGGTSIVAWEKDTDRPGWLDELDRLGNTSRAQMKLYETVINDTLKGIETLRQREDVGEVVLSGMWWCQTERDGSYLEFSEAYKKNLTNLINNIRKDLQAPNLPFLFFDQHIERKPGREVLKKNLRAVAAEVPFTALIDNNDLPKYEGIHFTTQGIWTLGERFAQAHLEMSE